MRHVHPEAVEALQELLEDMVQQIGEGLIVSVNENDSTVTITSDNTDRTINIPVKLCCPRHAVMSFLDNSIAGVQFALITGQKKVKVLTLDDLK